MSGDESHYQTKPVREGTVLPHIVACVRLRHLLRLAGAAYPDQRPPAATLFSVESVPGLVATGFCVSDEWMGPDETAPRLAALGIRSGMADFPSECALHSDRFDSRARVIARALLGGLATHSSFWIHGPGAWLSFPLSHAMRRRATPRMAGGVVLCHGGCEPGWIRHLPWPVPALEQLGHSPESFRVVGRRRRLAGQHPVSSPVAHPTHAFRGAGLDRLRVVVCADSPGANHSHVGKQS